MTNIEGFLEHRTEQLIKLGYDDEITVEFVHEICQHYHEIMLKVKSEQLKEIRKLKDFAYEVCPLHREDDLEEILGSL